MEIMRAIEKLLASPTALLTVTGDIAMSGVPAVLSTGSRVAVLPGAFNPVHDGHITLARAAAARLRGGGEDGDNYLFELSIAHPTKGKLELDDVMQRVRHFQERSLPVVLTHCPLFADKACALPGASFIVGADRLPSLLEARFYGNGTQEAMLETMRGIRATGCDFIVAGRALDGGAYVQFEDIAPSIPAELSALFAPLPGFRMDISSSEIRAKLAADAAAAKACDAAAPAEDERSGAP
jgi:nicotinic acid mononucleotide adenylyltransferase